MLGISKFNYTTQRSSINYKNVSSKNKPSQSPNFKGYVIPSSSVPAVFAKFREENLLGAIRDLKGNLVRITTSKIVQRAFGNGNTIIASQKESTRGCLGHNDRVDARIKAILKTLNVTYTETPWMTKTPR